MKRYLLCGLGLLVVLACDDGGSGERVLEEGETDLNSAGPIDELEPFDRTEIHTESPTEERTDGIDTETNPSIEASEGTEEPDGTEEPVAYDAGTHLTEEASNGTDDLEDSDEGDAGDYGEPTDEASDDTEGTDEASDDTEGTDEASDDTEGTDEELPADTVGPGEYTPPPAASPGFTFEPLAPEASIGIHGSCPDVRMLRLPGTSLVHVAEVHAAHTGAACTVNTEAQRLRCGELEIQRLQFAGYASDYFEVRSPDCRGFSRIMPESSQFVAYTYLGLGTQTRGSGSGDSRLSKFLDVVVEHSFACTWDPLLSELPTWIHAAGSALHYIPCTMSIRSGLGPQTEDVPMVWGLYLDQNYLDVFFDAQRTPDRFILTL